MCMGTPKELTTSLLTFCQGSRPQNANDFDIVESALMDLSVFYKLTRITVQISILRLSIPKNSMVLYSHVIVHYQR